MLNCLQIRIKKSYHPASFTTTSASYHSPQMSQPHMLYLLRAMSQADILVCQFGECRESQILVSDWQTHISAKILHLIEMFTSTVHNIFLPSHMSVFKKNYCKIACSSTYSAFSFSSRQCAITASFPRSANVVVSAPSKTKQI